MQILISHASVTAYQPTLIMKVEKFTAIYKLSPKKGSAMSIKHQNSVSNVQTESWSVIYIPV